MTSRPAARNACRPLALAVLCGFAAIPASAGPGPDLPVPIKNINTVTGGSSFDLGAQLGSFFYYRACEDVLGCELYRTPVAGTGAELVKDIRAGSPSSNPTGFVTAGGTLFFRGLQSLYKSDGTAAGTQLVEPFIQLPLGVGEEMAVLGNQVVFKADHLGIEGEVWVSDGVTTTGFDICPGACDANPLFFTTAGNRVFFVADDGSGRDLWKYEAGAVTPLEVNPAGAAFPSNLAALNGNLIFQANFGEVGLWVSDGATNTKIAGSLQDFSGLFELVVAGNLAYFDGCCGESLGRELWISNGTTAGTAPILDIHPGSTGSEPQQLTPVGSSIFFTADDGTGGRELWISVNGDGGTTLPLEIVPGGGAPSFLGSFTNLDGQRLFFAADDGSGTGREPWVSDGTPGGTTMVGDLATGPDWGIGTPVVAASGWAYFPSSALDDGEELWRSDGASALKLTELGTMSSGSDIDEIVSAGGFGYFCAFDGVTGTELWRTDGTSAGTVRLEDVAPVGGPAGCEQVTLAAGLIFFTGWTGSAHGLWATSGAPGAATLLQTFQTKPRELTAHAGLLFFAGNDGGGFGEELWRSNGTAGGTFMIEDGYPGSISTSPSHLTSAGSLLYFTGRRWSGGNNTADLEPFVSDGTAAGTVLLKDIVSGIAGSYPGDYAALGSVVIFAATTADEGEELWVSDGSAGGTVLLKDIQDGSSSGLRSGFTVIGSLAYFEGNDGSTGNELWRTDGTAGGTVLVEDIRSGSGSSSPRDFAVAGGNLLFSADDGNDGREPWIVQGGSASQLFDVNPGGSSNPRDFFASGVGAGAYFSADDGSGGGGELWHTDGTPGGTAKVADLVPDDSGNPEAFADLGSQIVFAATVVGSGQELWSFGQADCGDAQGPDLPTLLADAGACHRIAENTIRLGTERDADPDGQPTPGADGDDLGGLDDEDGVVFTSTVAVGEDATFSVTMAAPARLNVWIDWDGDGYWYAETEHVVRNRFLAVGTHLLTVPVPTDAEAGASVARFRVDSFGIAHPGGIVFDGEVEDHAIDIVQLLDFGDAPDPLVATGGEYPTLLANDGARHRVVAGVHLGATIDSEVDGQPSVASSGDDQDGADDEDGVVFTSELIPGTNATVQVTASVAGWLWGWVDFDRNGVWNGFEELIVDEVNVVAGVNDLVFAVPAGAAAGLTHARFRFDTAGDAYEPFGYVDDGEVEDHLVAVGPAADLAVSKSGPPQAVPGETIDFAVVASNLGPSPALGATVVDAFDAALTGCTWSCSGGGGGSCSNPNGVGDVAESVDLPVGGSVTFLATCSIPSSETGSIENTATVAPPAGVVDANAGNDTSAVSVPLQPTADLAISKTDGLSVVVPPDSLTYTIEVHNAGPSDVTAAEVTDLFPGELSSVQWSCVAGLGASCAAAGAGDIVEQVDLDAGTSLVFTASALVEDGAPAMLVNLATVEAPAGVDDPVEGNDEASDETELAEEETIVLIDGFESGDTSQWSFVGRGGDRRIELGPTDDLELELELAIDAAALRRIPAGRHVLLRGEAGNGHAVLRIVVEKTTEGVELRPAVRGLEGAWVLGTASPLPGAVPDSITLVWRRALLGSRGSLLLSSGGELLGWVEDEAPGPALTRLGIYGIGAGPVLTVPPGGR